MKNSKKKIEKKQKKSAISPEGFRLFKQLWPGTKFLAVTEDDRPMLDMNGHAHVFMKLRNPRMISKNRALEPHLLNTVSLMDGGICYFRPDQKITILDFTLFPRADFSEHYKEGEYVY